MLLTESAYDVKLLKEETGQDKKWYISGIFAQANVLNRNKRIYPMRVMESGMNDYITEHVARGSAVGELSHPDNLTINLDRVCHKIVDLKKDGNNYVGKSLVLNTPAGKTLQGLLEGGVRLGVSTRGMGSLSNNARGISEVQNDFKLIAIDSVFHPSAPEAFVQGLMEGASWVWDKEEKDIQFIESLKVGVEKANMNRLQEAKLHSLNSMMKYLES